MLVKALRPLAVLAGVLIVVWLVWEIGIATLVHELGKLSWRLPLILLPQIVTNLFKTEAWRLAFPRRRPGFGLLFPVRLAGEAVNETTPTNTAVASAIIPSLRNRFRMIQLLRIGTGSDRIPFRQGLPTR